jgi:E3 ubiquitin-protein ligase UHRF1
MGPNSKHQDWNDRNSALRLSVVTEKPVRVIRGYKGDSVWGPKEGFTYSGLYEVVACWIEEGLNNLHALTDQ